MATNRTLKFLPSIFQTDANKKFLGATLDQLVTEPEYTRLKGFIGRKFAPTYKSSDYYVDEINNTRQNYQLEPSLIIKDENDEVEFYSSYIDLLNKIEFYGGDTTNQDRLFSSEYYSYNSLINEDKFINFNQYYWLPIGPDPVLVEAGNALPRDTFVIKKDNNRFLINDIISQNPTLTLIRGGSYTFEVDQTSNFWIQSAPGTTGVKSSLITHSTRDVLGVTNNGTNSGTISFTVPLADSQDEYLKMPRSAFVDYAVDYGISELDGKLVDEVIAEKNGLDGVNIGLWNGKTIVFLTNDTADEIWTLSDGTVVSVDLRHWAWRIIIEQDEVGRDVINLQPAKVVESETKIYVRLGNSYANREFYLDLNDEYHPLPSLTAQQEILYYQDESDPELVGKIKIIDSAFASIDVNEDILGSKYYTSPNGVEFTSGLVITFNEFVTPSSYANNTFVIEGVGKSITLTRFDYLQCPESYIENTSINYQQEPFSTEPFNGDIFGPLFPEYIVSNRSSKDLNPWARQNRWFHADVISKSAEYNNKTPLFDLASRAKRPIIEFLPGLQMFNFGRIGKKPIDHVITDETNAFVDVQHSRHLSLLDTELKIGERILFANDIDPLVRSQIYTVGYSIQDEPSYNYLYDGVGVGTIDVENTQLEYSFEVPPVWQEQTAVGTTLDDNGNTVTLYKHRYKWTIYGDDNLMTAIRVNGYVTREVVETCTIISVTNTADGEYELIFDLDEPIWLPRSEFELDFIEFNLEVIGARGVAYVNGSGTKFLEELPVGSILFDDAGNQLGVVAYVYNDERLRLESPMSTSRSGYTFQYRVPRIQLSVSEDLNDEVYEFDTIVALKGKNKGISFWYNGTSWIAGQQKTKSHQAPFFDVYDQNNVSFSTYNNNNFLGTKIFSYKVGSGALDAELNFPLSYKNSLNTAADILFENNYDKDTFVYNLLTTLDEVKVNTGYVPQYTSRYEYNEKSAWTKVEEPSRQYQILSYTYNGSDNSFEIDISNDEIVLTPTIKVLVNNNILENSNYSLTTNGVKQYITIPSEFLTFNSKIDILIYSRFNVSSIGYYQIPVNLDVNAKNIVSPEFTLGQLRTHFGTILKNTGVAYTTGEALTTGINTTDIRDANLSGIAGTILQHSAPVIYPMLFMVSDQANFIDAADYARREYTKFKNKFFEFAEAELAVGTTDPVVAVDNIMAKINAIKSSAFPWYYSDMFPYGPADTTKYIVSTVDDLTYSYRKIYNPYELQSRSVLVYLNGVQLIHGIDFTFHKSRPEIIINADSVTLSIGAEIEIKDFTSTDGCYVPETPTKLGLYPAFMPEIFEDGTGRTTVDMIRGHDGSLTPVFGDFRDDIILELEKRIYNNIKRDPEILITDLREFVPGRFRNTDYAQVEFNRIMNTGFLKWAGLHSLDYTSHSWFNSNDSFTFNYSKTRDVLFNDAIPGWWRGAFRFFFDTDRPHTHPWEMLGFSEMPTWWNSEYGDAPYTAGNKILWEDLEAGRIKQGPKAGVNLAYARPGLSKVIPVNDYGELRSPMEFMCVTFDSTKGSGTFLFGDGAPVEDAWRTSSEYPFVLQQAIAVMKPAVYFGTMFDVSRYYKNIAVDQFNSSTTQLRVQPTDIVLNGETVNHSVTKSSGYVNYILDYLTSLGYNATEKVRRMLDKLTVQLSYKVAGYTDKKFLTVLAEQYSPTSTNESIIIPDESYEIRLNKNVPLERIAYSAVIVEKTNTGYVVKGYNTNRPYFVIIPSEVTNNNYSITANGYSATVYKDYKKQTQVIPYGTEFNNHSQLVDFLISYERFLEFSGFVFDTFDNDLSRTKNWALASEEFLTWAGQKWESGSVIMLSPVGDKINLITDFTIADKITNSVNGSKVLDSNFGIIGTNNLSIVRNQEEMSVESATGQTIAFIELNLTQYEHIILFDNITEFNDVIYQPETASRQFRLKLEGKKTANWTGTLMPPGFIYNSPTIADWRAGVDYKLGDVVQFKKRYYAALQAIPAQDKFSTSYWRELDKKEIKTGLLPNFANNAGKFIDIYDLDSTNLDEEFYERSAGLIGFKQRQYLTDIGVNLNSQAKFYQGYIKEKGTKKALDSIISAKFQNIENNIIACAEEWGVRVGEYGALDNTRYVEVRLNEDLNVSNPADIAITDIDEVAPDTFVSTQIKDLYSKSFAPDFVKFPLRDGSIKYATDISTAGYVSLDDVDTTVFDILDTTELSQQIEDIGDGYYIWAANDLAGNWQTYRVNVVDAKITKIEYALDNKAKITTNSVHNLKEYDLIVIKGIDNEFNGIYIVDTLINLTSFTVPVSADQSSTLETKTISKTGLLHKLVSTRVETSQEVIDIIPESNWSPGDLIYVDKDPENWAVYQNSNSLQLDSFLESVNTDYDAEGNYGSAVKIHSSGKYAFVGSANSNNGTGDVQMYVLGSKNIVRSNLHGPGTDEISGLGASVEASDDYLFVGAPTTRAASGIVFVYKINENTKMVAMQAIIPPVTQADAYFGNSISATPDNKWLFIGSPGEDAVHYYKLTDVEEWSEVFILGQAETLTLEHPIVNRDAIAVYQNEKLLVEGTEYIIEDEYRIIITQPMLDEDYSSFVSEIGSTSFVSENAPSGGTYRVVARPYYQYVGRIRNEENNRLGESVKVSADAKYIAVGAPGADVAGKKILGFLTNEIATVPASISGEVFDYKYASGYFKLFNGTTDVTLDNNVVYSVVDSEGINITIDPETGFYSVDSMSDDSGKATLRATYNTNNTNVIDCIYSLSKSKEGHIGLTGSDKKHVELTVEHQQIEYDLLGQNPTPLVIKVTAMSFNTQGTVYYEFRVDDLQEQNITLNTLDYVPLKNVYDMPQKITVNVRENSRRGEIVATDTLTMYGVNGAYNTDIKETVLNAGQVLIYELLDSGDVSLKQEIRIEPVENSKFGYSVDLSADGIDLHVGSPDYRSINYSGGKVSRFVRNSKGFYEFKQDIYHPRPISGENFGEVVRLSRDNNTLIVSSTKGTTTPDQFFDNGETTFDSSSTTFFEKYNGAGSVFVYSTIGQAPDNIFVYSTELMPDVSTNDDRFGSSIDVLGSRILVGASFNDSVGSNAGRVYNFVSQDGNVGWYKKYQYAPRVDVESINRAFIYDVTSNKTTAMLDYIDPVKGKILGVVAENIDIRSSNDPAYYNAGTGVYSDEFYYWGKEQVGKIWWNLSSLKYIEYEYGPLDYRSYNWGKIFPGSRVSVCEWVESIVPPSEYNSYYGNIGTPLYSNDEAYVAVPSTDPITGAINLKYYFWVEAKTTKVPGSNKSMSAYSITVAIQSPETQGIPYAAFYSNNSVGLYNCYSSISGKDTILHIDYDKKHNTQKIHSEFELYKTCSDIPVNSKVFDKIVDSLSGEDRNFRRVPDPMLNKEDQLGMSVRPRQSLIKDRHEALRNIAGYLNDVFKVYPVAYKLLSSNNYDNLGFYQDEPIPDRAEFTHYAETDEELQYVPGQPGDTVLVAVDSTSSNLWSVYKVSSTGSLVKIRNQIFHTTRLWNFVPWYADGFDSSVRFNYIVETFAEVDMIENLVAGDVVKVNDGGADGYELFKLANDGTWNLIALENGTVEFTDLFWDIKSNDVGFDNSPLDSFMFDVTHSREIRNIIYGLRDYVLIDELSPYISGLMAVIFEYILSEQKQVDWLFKTSFVNVLHYMRELNQPPNFTKDNHDYMESYIDEVKPYRSKVREYRVGYTKTDESGFFASDFDIPGYYDTTVGRFRSPDGTLDTDKELLTTNNYVMWNSNHNNYVSSIIVSNPGYGFTQPPQIVIVSTDGTGSGATAEASINEKGQLVAIVVSNPGQGYIETPIVVINGNGTGASATAIIKNDTVRKLKTTIKFDRVDYNPNLTEWIPNTLYPQGSVVSYKQKGYIADSEVAPLPYFDGTLFREVTPSVYATATDRVAALYSPKGTQPPKIVDSSGNISLYRLIDSTTYPLSKVTGTNANVYQDTDLSGPTFTVSSEEFDTNAINILGGNLVDDAIAYAPEELLPGIVYDHLNMVVYTKIFNGNVSFDDNGTISYNTGVGNPVAYDAGTTVALRISKFSNKDPEYHVVTNSKIKELVSDLLITDTEISLNNVEDLTLPNIDKKIPGVVYINGEKIHYYVIDEVNNKLQQIRRGVEGTGAPEIHLAGSKVEDAGETTRVPNVTSTNRFRVKFDPLKLEVKTNINVSEDLISLRNNVVVKVGLTKLIVLEDYNVEINTALAYPRIVVIFTEKAASSIPEDSLITIEYTRESKFIESGIALAETGGPNSQPTQGLLELSDTMSAQFLKDNPYSP